jgi:DNA-3-methyladenine glycosylase
MRILPQEFYARPARIVASDLLGKRLVRKWNGQRIAGFIVESEAYCDADEPDLACHGDRANDGRPTPRTEVMFGPAGYSYVYFTYGMHWMFNIVTGEKGQANAVLIRALEPVEGKGLMAQNRAGREQAIWTNGPAKLTQALAIDGNLNGACLFTPDGEVWIENEPAVSTEKITRGPRIGLGNTPEPWLSMPWRYWLNGNKYVSGKNYR